MWRLTLWSMTQDTSFWGRLGKPEQTALLEYTTRDVLPPGDRLIRQRGRSRSVMIILRGWAAVVSEPDPRPGDPTGPGANGRLLAFRGEGDIVGDMAGLLNKPRSASLRALDEVEVLELEDTQFKDFLWNHKEAWWTYTEILAERVDEQTANIHFQKHKTSMQIPEILVSLVDKVGRSNRDGIWLPYPRTQTELGSLIGISRESVSSTWSRLRDDGLVATRNGRMLILDLEGLRKIYSTDE